MAAYFVSIVPTFFWLYFSHWTPRCYVCCYPVSIVMFQETVEDIDGNKDGRISLDEYIREFLHARTSILAY